MSDRLRRRLGRKKMAAPWTAFERLRVADYPKCPPGVTRVYVNSQFIVLVKDQYPTTHGMAIQAMVQRWDGEPVHDWSALQRVKNEVFGARATAIEYYPAVADLVDVANVYWLWLFAPGVLPAPIDPNY